MSLFQAIILGLIQGITEFFPVSSSAHLKLARFFMQIEETGPFFDLVCHSGTLLALLLFLRKRVFEVLKSFSEMSYFFVALLPLVPAYFLFKPIREHFSDISFLPFAFFFTATLLFLANRKKSVEPTLACVSHTISSKDDATDCADLPRECEKCGIASAPAANFGESRAKKWSTVLCIGMMQTIALIPGVSRSGSTIAAGRFCGLSFIKAAEFSFLLAIPTIIGGEVLELVKGVDLGSMSIRTYLAAFFTSFIVGLFSVRLIFWVYKEGKVAPLALYCFCMGLITWIVLHG